jgi:hypothetical protein
MPQISVTCPFCAKRNDITASELPEPIEIYCSHCHAPLGTWSKLEQDSKHRRSAGAINGEHAS